MAARLAVEPSAHAGGGLFHAAGLIRDNRGELFIGKSGSGKSTLARACGDDEILSDELTAVRRDAGAFTVHGTPFMASLAWAAPIAPHG